MLTRLTKTVLISLTTLMLSSCSVSKSTEYESQTFKDLYPEFDISDKKYSPYIYHDILLSSEIKEINYDIFIIWLGFYTKLDSAEVFIEGATITGNGLTKEIDVNERVKINENLVRDSETYNLRSASYKLIEIGSYELSKYVDNNHLAIEITYNIDGEIQKTTFEFERKIVKRFIYPT